MEQTNQELAESLRRYTLLFHKKKWFSNICAECLLDWPCGPYERAIARGKK